MDHERDRPETPNTQDDGGLFAARPIWEQRGRKRGVFGGRKAPAPAPTVSPEPRSFAAERDDEEPMALDTPVDPVSGDIPRTSYADIRENAAAATPTATEADSGMVAPIGRPSTRADRAPRSKNIGPAAIAAGVVALGAIGAVGWYASRDNGGIAELAPGQATESQVAAAPLTPVDLPPSPPAAADTAVNPPLAAAEPPRASVTPAAPRRTASATRTSPAAPSAEDTAVNTAATTLPAGPQPYSTLNPGATPPAPVNPAPIQAAPPPSEAPAAIPSTPTLPAEPPM